MNHNVLMIAAASVAVTLTMALIFVPSFGTLGLAMTPTQKLSNKQVLPVAYHQHGLTNDNLNLQMASSFVSLTPQQAFADMRHGAHVVNMNLVAIQQTIQLP